MPRGQEEHDETPVVCATEPAAHGEQNVVPVTGASEPLAHGVHATALYSAEYEPVAHKAHTDGAETYDPGAQLMAGGLRIVAPTLSVFAVTAADSLSSVIVKYVWFHTPPYEAGCIAGVVTQNATMTEPCVMPMTSMSSAVVPSPIDAAIPALNVSSFVLVQPATLPSKRKVISGVFIFAVTGGGDGGTGGGGDGGGAGGGAGGGGASPHAVCPTAPNVPVPSAHGCASVFPSSGQYVLTGHTKHTSLVDAPTSALYMPRGHFVQSSNDTASTSVPYVPAGHDVHDVWPPPLYVPAPQIYCAAEEVTSSQYIPGGQYVHPV
jgi:hypothetical protein